MRALLVLLATLLASSATAAPRRWAIAEVRIEGDVDAAARTELEERAWSVIALTLPTDALLAPHDVVARALAEAPALRGCADDRCSLALGDRLGVERLVTVRLERRGDGWTARLLAYAVDAAEVAGTLELPCPGCSSDGLMDAFSRAVAPLLRADRARPLCTLTVNAPRGATVSVDTVALGEAPFTHTVVAGRHTVTLAAPPARAEVDCPVGGARSVRLGRGGGSPRAWHVGLGVTAAALAAGSLAGLITAAAFQDRAACDGARCAFRYDATTGIALGAVGVAVFGGAAAVLLATGRHGSSQAALAPTPSGLALLGSF